MGGVFKNPSYFYDHISSHRAKWNTWKQWRKDAQRRYFDRAESLINRQRRLNKRLSDSFGTQRPQVRILSSRPIKRNQPKRLVSFNFVCVAEFKFPSSVPNAVRGAGQHTRPPPVADAGSVCWRSSRNLLALQAKTNFGHCKRALAGSNPVISTKKSKCGSFPLLLFH